MRCDGQKLHRRQRAPRRVGVKASIATYLDRWLELPVSGRKCQVAKTEHCELVGFSFNRDKLRWSDSSFEDFKHRVRELKGRRWGVSMAYRYEKLGEYL